MIAITSLENKAKLSQFCHLIRQPGIQQRLSICDADGI